MNMHGSHISDLLRETRFSRRSFVSSGLAAGLALAAPRVAAARITTDSEGLVVGEVKIPVAGGDVPAYRAMPAGGGRFAVVLVLHEVFGVNAHIQDICRRFARLGYFAVAPVLYSREGNVRTLSDIAELSESEIDKIRNIVYSVPEPQVASDLDATIAWLETVDSADITRLGLTGFSWGGRQVWLYAEHNPRIKAAVAWYGKMRWPKSELSPYDPIDQVSKLQVPMLGLYGDDDVGIPVAQLDEMRGALKAAGKVAEVVVYPGTPHGFNADYRPNYRAEQAKDGWQRQLGWFRKYGVA
jgi:carboxymethylenebutenolidase